MSLILQEKNIFKKYKYASPNTTESELFGRVIEFFVRMGYTVKAFYI